MGFVDRVKDKASKTGRGFNHVTHPTPEASVIEADWPIAVEIGELQI